MLEADEISCQIPNSVPPGSTLDLDMLNVSVQHAQICSDILKSLYAAKSHHQSTEEMLQKVRALQQRLEDWQVSLPGRLTLSQSGSAGHMASSGRNRANASRLLRAYNGSVMTLHASFHYPWIRSRLRKNGGDAAKSDTPSASSAQAAAAARRIIESLKDCAPECISPSP